MVHAAAAGARDRHGNPMDITPGSRTLVLHLAAGDEVWIEEHFNSKIADYKLTFCVYLLHLDKVR